MNAQTLDPRAAAEAVAREALAALDARDWSRVADLMHPEALDAIRSQTLSSLRRELRIREEPPRWPGIRTCRKRWPRGSRNRG